MQNRWRNEHAKFWVLREMAKWTVASDDPWLMATAVATNSRLRFSNRWHVANIKNIAGDDQETLMVHQNSRYRAYLPILPLFMSTRLRLVLCGNGSCHGLVPYFFEEVKCCQRQNHHRRWPGNSNGRSKLHKYCTYLPILCVRDRDWFSVTYGGFRRSLKRHVANVINIAGDDQITLRIDRNSAGTKIFA